MTDTAVSSASSASRGDKRSRTRAALIDAAALLIREEGYEKVTLASVAARAGMTTGAIYGNFKNREDLIIAVAQDRWRPITPRIEPGMSLKEYMRVIGVAVAAAARERRPTAVLAAAYRAFILGNEEARREAQRQGDEAFAIATQGFVRFFPQELLPMPAAQFVRVLSMMIDGFLFAYATAPDRIDEEMIVAAFEAMAP